MRHVFDLPFFEYILSVSNLGSCSNLESLSFSRVEFNITKLRSTLVSNFDFEIKKIGFDIGCRLGSFDFLFTTVKINTEETRSKQKKKRKRDIQQTKECIKKMRKTLHYGLFTLFAAFFGLISRSAHFPFSSFSFWHLFLAPSAAIIGIWVFSRETNKLKLA